jgi:tight adherence protein B
VTLALVTTLAAIAGGLGGMCAAIVAPDLARGAVARLAPLQDRAARELFGLVEPLRRAGAEGVIPTDRERLRLQAGAGAAGLALGTLALGPLAGAMLSVVAAIAASRSLRWRRARYAARVDAGVAGAALAIADALAGWHSARGALIEASGALRGPIGIELRRVARDLQMGAETDVALDRLRRRARSRRVDLVVAAIRLQRRSGGSLAALLREISASTEDQDRLRHEAHAATAQARFTSLVVLMLPLTGLLLGELALPGMVHRMTESAIGVWLIGTAGSLQIAGVLMVRRIGRVDR